MCNMSHHIIFDTYMTAGIWFGWWKLYGLAEFRANISYSVLLHERNQDDFCLITFLKGSSRSMVNAIADKISCLTRYRHKVKEMEKRQRRWSGFKRSTCQLKDLWTVGSAHVNYVNNLIFNTRKVTFYFYECLGKRLHRC